MASRPEAYSAYHKKLTAFRNCCKEFAGQNGMEYGETVNIAIDFVSTCLLNIRERASRETALKAAVHHFSSLLVEEYDGTWERDIPRE